MFKISSPEVSGQPEGWCSGSTIGFGPISLSSILNPPTNRRVAEK